MRCRSSHGFRCFTDVWTESKVNVTCNRLATNRSLPARYDGVCRSDGCRMLRTDRVQLRKLQQRM